MLENDGNDGKCSNSFGMKNLSYDTNRDVINWGWEKKIWPMNYYVDKPTQKESPRWMINVNVINMY